ncbi:MAG: FtsX-like permease family protein, partial [Bacillota bacterium]|nr:FtsX-like permease family protein [Bacillota bacterium]
VDKKYYRVLKDKGISAYLEGVSNLDNKSRVVYKIVGAYESMAINNVALSFLEADNKGHCKYYYYSNLKSRKDKIELAKEIAKITKTKFDSNNKLLYYMGQGPDKKKNDAVATMFFFIFAFVIICTAVVIYNAFSISVMERIKHFGILRSIGATKSQISSLVFYESLIMSGISIPLGVIIGYFGSFIVFNVFMSGFLGQFKISFYPSVVLLAAVLGVFTVFFSAFLPALTASRVSPVDAIKGTSVIKSEKIKRRKGIFAKLVFGFEGQVAYKNIKRSRKRFYVTCVSLSLSLIMFVFFSNLVDIVLETNKLVSINVKVQGVYQTNSNSMSDEFAQKIANLEGIGVVYKLNYVTIPMIVDKKAVNKEFVDSQRAQGSLTEYKDYYIVNMEIISYDKYALEFFNKENKKNIDYEKFKKDGCIVINKAMGDNLGSDFYDAFTNYKKDDKLRLTMFTKEYINKPDKEILKKSIEKNGIIDFKVTDIEDYETLNGSPIRNGFGVVISDESFKRLTGIKNYNTIGLMYASEESRNNVYEKLNLIADENNVKYYDIYEQEKLSKDLINQLMVLIYGFISMIILISCVNIINTVTINLLVKKREYAVFKAIGMTRSQFVKLVLLEGALFGIFASIIGLPVGFLITKYGIIARNPMGYIGYHMSIWPYLVGAIGVIAITLLSALIPLRKLNDMNIVEALRVEE